MNNKPVAWMSNESFEVSTLNIGRFDIPLYTHPVKELTELTNEEIRKVINEIVDGVTVSEMVTFLAISKAILRKAQEK